MRSVVYEGERNGIYVQDSDLFKVHYSKDYAFNDFRKDVLENKRNSGRKQNGRSNGETKFSLKENDTSKKYSYELSDGQIKKLIADITMKKVYSKVESETLISIVFLNNDIISKITQ